MMDAAGYARPRPAPLTVAAAQPACAPADVRSNALEHARLIRQAAARVVVFPELSLTGYELGAQAVSPDDPELAVIAEACSETGAIALAGAPVAGDAGTLHIAMLLLSSGGAQVAYRKSFLGGAEPRHYVPGGGPVRLDIDGWRVGLGICKDTGVREHIDATAALGVDLYIAGLVHYPEELGIQEERAARIARACDAYVVFASFAGATGGGYARTAGGSSIWSPDGRPIARAGAEPGDIARATLTTG
jgi:predicted amidohydrolase